MLARSISLLTAISAAAFGFWSSAQACEVRPGALKTTTTVYDPFAASGLHAQAEMALDLIDGKACDVTVRLLDGRLQPIEQIAVGGPNPALFTVETPGAFTPDTLVLHLDPARPHATVVWTFKPGQDAVLHPGRYDVPLAVGIRPDTATSDTYVYGTFTVSVPARAQVNIAGASGRFGSSHASAIDFGQLTTGAHRRAFVQIRANTGVFAQISSKNHGVLRNEAWPDASPISYSLVLNGIPINLNLKATESLDPPATIDGLSLPMDITIGSVEGKFAGTYSDVITIEVSPR